MLNKRLIEAFVDVEVDTDQLAACTKNELAQSSTPMKSRLGSNISVEMLQIFKTVSCAIINWNALRFYHQIPVQQEE